MGLQIAFWMLSAAAVIAAAGVVWQKNLFRAALLLVVCFLATAGIFVTLSADFLAAAQVIINVGAVAILIIMSIMLTREVTRGSPANRLGVPAFFLTGIVAAAIIFAVFKTSWPLSGDLPAEPTSSALAHLLLGAEGFELVIQMGALLLLATIIGAIVLLKENK
ncbi:MAG: NADH-quinone oxidoreductase subunit J [Dehalococcoidaceae bacterium]|nr:NADH-quinone oxidoreductase subunit J [Dehalococcoidaceae bacterium]